MSREDYVNQIAAKLNELDDSRIRGLYYLILGFLSRTRSEVGR